MPAGVAHARTAPARGGINPERLAPSRARAVAALCRSSSARAALVGATVAVDLLAWPCSREEVYQRGKYQFIDEEEEAARLRYEKEAGQRRQGEAALVKAAADKGAGATPPSYGTVAAADSPPWWTGRGRGSQPVEAPDATRM